MYSEKDIQKFFLEVKNKAFRDISSKVYIKKLKVKGFSSPFTGKIYINLNRLNQDKSSKYAVIGLIAHELAHQVSYNRRSFFKKWFFLAGNYISIEKRRAIEVEADLITIERGYGKQLLASINSSYKHYAKEPKKLTLLRQVYLTPDEIRKRLTK